MPEENLDEVDVSLDEVLDGLEDTDLSDEEVLDELERQILSTIPTVHLQESIEKYLTIIEERGDLEVLDFGKWEISSRDDE